MKGCENSKELLRRSFLLRRLERLDQDQQFISELELNVKNQLSYKY